MQEIVVSNSWRERLDQLLGHRRETWLIAGVLLLVVGGSLALWSRDAPARIAPPSTTAQGALATPTSATKVLVHVAGAVQRPGLYEFPFGARVADAIATAGGARASADLDLLNLAEILVDGTKVQVPKRGAQPQISTPVTDAPTDSAPAVNINTADQAALETIPGIGPVTAAAILQHRTEVRAFSTVDELLDVDGIGPATLESIRPYVTVG